MQATQSEGRPSERARAWCSMIGASFFRFSPQLSVDITLDETEDDKLLLVCWETMVYLHRNQAKLVKLANILNQSSSVPRVRPWGYQFWQVTVYIPKLLILSNNIIFNYRDHILSNIFPHFRYNLRSIQGLCLFLRKIIGCIFF